MYRVIRANLIQAVDQRVLRFPSTPRLSVKERRLNCKQIRLPPLNHRPKENLLQSASLAEVQAPPHSSHKAKYRRQFAGVLHKLLLSRCLSNRLSQFKTWRASIQNGLQAMAQARAKRKASVRCAAAHHEHQEWLATLRRDNRLAAVQEASAIQLQRWVRRLQRQAKFRSYRLYLKALTYESRLSFFKYQQL